VTKPLPPLEGPLLSTHVLTGQGAPAVPEAGEHLPAQRPRTYPSDTCDAQWQVLASLVPAGGTRPERGGRPVVCPRRDVVDGIRYVVRTGCQWDALPAGFPPWPLVRHYFTAWTRDGTLGRIHDTLREQVRQAEGRTAQPSAALVDSQSVRGADTVGRSSRGYDAGKKTDGRKCGSCARSSHHPPDLGRLRLRRQAGRLRRDNTRADRADRAQTDRADHLHRAAPPLVPRAHLLLDQPLPAAPSATTNAYQPTTPQWSNGQ
jgi:transposase